MKKIAIWGLVLVLVLAFASIGAGWGPRSHHGPRLKSLALTDEYLSCDSIKWVWGPGLLDSKVDLKYGGVGFALSGLTDSGTGIGDNWWASPPPGPDALSGLAEHLSHQGSYTDATGYSKITLQFTNLGTDDVDICIYMNTGFTQGGWSADATGVDDSVLDTFWQSSWTSVPAGKRMVVKLDFSSATAYNIADDPVHTGFADGASGLEIFRLDEVSNLGFQVADFNGGPTTTWLVVGSPKWTR